MVIQNDCCRAHQWFMPVQHRPSLSPPISTLYPRANVGFDTFNRAVSRSFTLLSHPTSLQNHFSCWLVLVGKINTNVRVRQCEVNGQPLRTLRATGPGPRDQDQQTVLVLATMMALQRMTGLLAPANYLLHDVFKQMSY